MKKILLITLMSIFCFCGCSKTTPEQKVNNIKKFLPKEATNVETVGPNWYEFNYKGKRYLYKKNVYNASLAEVNTE